MEIIKLYYRLSSPLEETRKFSPLEEFLIEFACAKYGFAKIIKLRINLH
jgi:hypothetical protein